MYWYLDSTPTHSYMKFLYKYPQTAFPYEQIKEENQNRSRDVTEFELMDTDVFDEDKYWDIFVEVCLPLAVGHVCDSTEADEISTPRMRRMRTQCRSVSPPTTEAPMLPTCTSFPSCSSETPGPGPRSERTCRSSVKRPMVSLRQRTIRSARHACTVRPRLLPPHPPRAASSSLMVRPSCPTFSSLKTRPTLR